MIFFVCVALSTDRPNTKSSVRSRRSSRIDQGTRWQRSACANALI
uniref:Uncharacterized protein n=1 Tax=Lepeophtheirus salmonis TaxID=72036 RepID=A0A0K2TUI6_LEPSM